MHLQVSFILMISLFILSWWQQCSIPNGSLIFFQNNSIVKKPETYQVYSSWNTVRIFLSVDTIIDAPVYKEMNNYVDNNKHCCPWTLRKGIDLQPLKALLRPFI